MNTAHENENLGSVIHAREAAAFSFFVSFSGPLAMIACLQPGQLFEPIAVFTATPLSGLARAVPPPA